MAMDIGRIFCLFNRHRPVRERVQWNGTHYVAECRRCGRPIRRRTQGGWRAMPELGQRDEPAQPAP